MKKVFAALLVTLVGSAALAEVYVPYGRWVNLRYCGGQTRLICDDVRNARQQNRCFVEFRDVHNCDMVEMYPRNSDPYHTRLDRGYDSFYVDHDKVSHWDDSFRVNLESSYGRRYENIVYQFNY